MSIARRVWHVLAALLLVGCHPASTPPLLGTAATPDAQAQLLINPERAVAPREKTVAQARRQLAGTPYAVDRWTFEPDPVGFVRAALWAAGIEVVDASLAHAEPEADGMQLLFRSAADRGELHRHHPNPGDLVFFDAAPQAQALYPAQVAIVEGVDAQGTISALGHFANGPRRVRLNLRQAPPNDWVRGSATVPAGDVFRAFANPFRD